MTRLVTVLAALALLGLQGCVQPAARVEGPFASIRAGDIVSATVRVDDGTSKTCPLSAPQIAALLDILKQSRIPGNDRDGLSSDLTMFFVARGGERIVAVISKDSEIIDGEYPIFFRGKLAMLSPDAVDRITRIARAAGCRT